MESGTLDGEEKKIRIAAEKAKLSKQLAEGEIDGVEYNRRLIALMVPEEDEPRPPKPRRVGALITVVVIAIASVIPAVVYLNWRFYFQNTLTTKGVPDYSEMMASSVNDEPIQIDLDGYKESGKYKGRSIDITYKAYYDITGIVTSVRDYWGFSAYDTLVPRDVCLVWGSLAENYKGHEVEFSQGERNCKPRINGVEIDNLNYSAMRGSLGNTMWALHEFSNNHIIPSTPVVRQKIFGLRAGDLVRLTGYLVRVVYDGIVLNSSMTRNDSGDGACEVFYVTSVAS